MGKEQMTSELQQRRVDSGKRLAYLQSKGQDLDIAEEKISGHPHSLLALEHGVHDLQLRRIVAALPDELWFITLTFPAELLKRTREGGGASLQRNSCMKQPTREIAEDILRKHLYGMNKWLFGNSFRKHGRRWLTVLSCFELSPSNHAPHFHLIVEHPSDSPRASQFASTFVERWCRRTRASENAQQIKRERIGKERALSYVTKHTVLGCEFRVLHSTGQHVGEFDATNSRYRPLRVR